MWRSIWIFTEIDLNLHWVNMLFVGLVMHRLLCILGWVAEKRHKPRPYTRRCEDRSESSLSKHVICGTIVMVCLLCILGWVAEKRHKPRPYTRRCEDRSESSLSKHVICGTIVMVCLLCILGWVACYFVGLLCILGWVAEKRHKPRPATRRCDWPNGNDVD